MYACVKGSFFNIATLRTRNNLVQTAFSLHKN